MNYVKAALLVIFAEALIYLGITFLSQQLLPSRLEPIYRLWPGWIKLACFTVIVALPANLIISTAYRSAGASFVGVVYSVAVILGAVIVAILVDQIRINLSLSVAIIALIGAAVWVAVALEEAKRENKAVERTIGSTSTVTLS